MSRIDASSLAVSAFNSAYQRSQQSIARSAQSENPAQALAETSGSLSREQVLQQAAIHAMKIARSQQMQALDLLA